MLRISWIFWRRRRGNHGGGDGGRAPNALTVANRYAIFEPVGTHRGQAHPYKLTPKHEHD
ncbi:MAG: hypothetical protein DWI61_05010 [Chloroflexi bacterium]|nr:MAG: hypothetical protein DWI61_05010 [Chloroflexota bacterium]RLT50039.1 MAG: hypothetical protein DWI64_01335 [Chloroflexota bacterium]